MKKQTKEFTTASNKLNTLYQTAIGRCLDKMDIDVLEWLNPEEQAEYRKLALITDGECPFCGEIEKDCECKL